MNTHTLLPTEPPTQNVHAAVVPSTAVGAVAASLLSACGGGSDGSGVEPPAEPAGPMTREQASRALAQGAFGGTPAEIEHLRGVGLQAWLAEQFAMPRSAGHVQWMREKGYGDVDSTGAAVRLNSDRQGVERSVWRKMISSPDVLRQRVVLALTEIFVISIIPVLLPWRGFACASLVDILEANAFGNYRDLLLQVSRNPAMARYLTFLNNAKADGEGSAPDENYARELIQLFTLGVLKLRPDGEPLLEGGVPVETYGQEDVSQLARVFTGWRLDQRVGGLAADFVIRPLIQNPRQHEPGPKVFLGTTIEAGTDGEESLAQAIDALMNHPNMGPFVGRQLIQRLVTSDPSPAYVARVSAAFDGDGSRAKGDMKATLVAILTDVEATGAAGLTNPRFGKLREPMLRFLQWARTFGLNSANERWDIGNLSDPATGLGQSPLRSASVFNFFRPGFVPPNTALGAAGITAPEFQITTESSVAGYLNFMQQVVGDGIAGMQPDYSALMPLVNDSTALLAELNVLLAAGQLSAATLAAMKAGIDSIATTSPAGQRNRVRAAVMLVLAAPEYLVQK